MMKELKNATTPALSLKAASRTATASGVGVDLAAATATLIDAFIGDAGITFDANNYIKFTLEDSPDNSTFTAVADNLLIGANGNGSGEFARTAPGATDAVYSAGYVGGQRYIRVTATFVGTHGAGTPVGANVITTQRHVGGVAK